MAIRRADFYSRHVQRVKWVSVGMLVAVNAALTTLLIASGVSLLVLTLFILLPVIVLEVFAVIIILRFAMEPLAILSQAVAYVSTETNDVTPPAINEPRHERSGLKVMVQTIYDSVAESGSGAERPGHSIVADSLASQLIESIPSGIIALDEQGKILYANSTAPVETNQKGEQSIELAFTSDDTINSWLKVCSESKVNDEHVWSRIQSSVPGTDGRKIYDIFAHYQKGGSPEAILLFIDRTGHYSPDEEDMDFIALAAHELRGPITVIRGYLDVLENELSMSLQPDQKLLIERLNVSAARLSGYVSNILNVSRYDRRHLKLHLREDKLSDVYATIADDLQLRATTQNRLLNVTIPTDLPTIAADRNSLSEVLANLVDNAIKYSNEGGQVNVTAIVDGDFVTCSVQDHGIGIPGSLVGNLFTKFYRSHRSRQSVTGTGLGLYISKGIIESHGGKIGLRSQEGQGSTFTFSVPVYSTVKDKLSSGNEGIIESSSGWIKNHAMYRG